METLVSKPDDPALAPGFTGSRDIGHQQYPRPRQPLGRAIAFPYQRFAARRFQSH
jgi:hypothetical protein